MHWKLTIVVERHSVLAVKLIVSDCGACRISVGGSWPLATWRDNAALFLGPNISAYRSSE